MDGHRRRGTSAWALTAVISLVAAPASRGATVLWDLTHGVVGGYSPNAQYLALKQLLASDGIAIVTTSSSVTTLDLSGYDAIVVGLGSTWNSAYTAGEVAVIQAFVATGRGLLILGDNPLTPNANIAALASAFGVTLGANSISPNNLYVTQFEAGNPIFAGVQSIHFLAAGGLQFTGASKGIATASTGEVVVAQHTTMPVVVVGDINGWENGEIVLVDNRRFVRNLFEYLAEGCTADLGHGVPGAGGLVPKLVVPAASCNGTLQLSLTDALGGAPALLLAGVSAGATPAFGGTIYVDFSTPPALAVALSLGGATGTAGAGTLTISSDLSPYTPFTLALQVAVADAGAAFGVALSNGVEWSPP